MSAIRTAFAFDIECYNPAAVIKCYPIDERNQRRLDILAANSHQFVLNTFGIVYSFDTHLIVNSEDHYTAPGVGESDDFLRDSFGV